MYITMGRYSWLGLAVMLVHSVNACVAERAPDRSADAKAGTKLVASTCRVPMVFEKNTGQLSSDALYLSRDFRGRVEFHRGRARWTLAPRPQTAPPDEKNPLVSTDITYEGSFETTELIFPVPTRGVQAHRRLKGKGHSYIGTNPTRWRENIPLNQELRYRDVWPGTDLFFEVGASGRLSYRVVLQPESELDHVVLKIGGVGEPRLDENGNLVVKLQGGTVVHSAPRFFAHEPDGSRGRELKGEFRLAGRALAFRCDDRQLDEGLEIDPEILFGGFTDEVTNTEAYIMELEPSGPNRVFLTVTTMDDLNGSLVEGTTILHLSVSDPANPTVLSVTTLMGARIDGTAVDGSGGLYLAGTSFDGQFPSTPGAFQTNASSNSENAVVAWLAPDGTLNRGTYLGEPASPADFDIRFRSHDVAVLTDATGVPRVGVVGEVFRRNHSTGSAPPADYRGPSELSETTYAGYMDGYVAVFDASLGTLSAFRLHGGNALERVRQITASGSTWLALGETSSTNLPVTNDAQQSALAAGPVLGQDPGLSQQDLMLMEIGAGAELIYSSYFGGPTSDAFPAFVADDQGRAAAVFKPIVQFGLQPPDVPDLALATFDDRGKTLLSAANLPYPVSGNALAFAGIGMLPDGNVALAMTARSGFPASLLTPDAFDTTNSGGECAIAIHTPNGSAQFVSFLGGSSSEYVKTAAAGPDGGFWVAGLTTSADFPTTSSPSPVAPGSTGTYAIFVTKIGTAPSVPTLELLLQDDPDPVLAGSSLSFPVQVHNSGTQSTGPMQVGGDFPTGLLPVDVPDVADEVINGPHVEIPVPALAPGSSFSATVAVLAQLPGTYTSMAELQTLTGQVLATASQETTVLGVVPEPILVVKVSGPAATNSGSLVNVYTLTLRNIGDAPATNVEVTDELVPYKYIQFSNAIVPPGGGEVELQGAYRLSWRLPNLPAGEQRMLTANAVVGSRPGRVQNRVVVTADEFPGEEADSDMITTTVDGPDGDLAVSVDPPENDPENVSNEQVWRIHVSSQMQTSGSLFPIRLMVEFDADDTLTAEERFRIRLVGPGQLVPAVPFLKSGSPSSYVTSLNLATAAELPQSLGFIAPLDWDVVLSNLKVTAYSLAIDDEDFGNNVWP